MILYFSGRCCCTYAIPSRPETILKNKAASIMMSYSYAKKADIKRFNNIIKSRRKEKQNANK